MQRLRQFVQKGNSLIAFAVIGRGMSDVFGFGSYRERSDLSSMTFNEGELTARFVFDPAESMLNLTAPGHKTAGVSYGGLINPAIARFEDGSGAIIYNSFEEAEKTGYAYAIGFDVGHFALRAFNGRLANVVEDYVNDYHPKVDTLLRFIATVYWQGEPDSVRISSAPFNKDLTVLITHDIDFTRSIRNIGAYLDLELQQGVPATYFIQTKYVTDYNDKAFFNEYSRPAIERLVASGMEVASHSVAHSNEFRHMPLGSGEESYPDYQPFVKDFETVQNASIAGELRVSRFLLESLGGQQVTAFRPGHLSLPRNLPEMLKATGYRYSSSITANEALTHLPYQTMVASEYATESPIFEFPVTIEDEQYDLSERLEESITLANKIARHQGLVNLLIHTDVTGDKLEFQRQFVEEFRERAWFSTVSLFGNWWRLRDSTVVDVEELSPQTRRLSVAVEGTIEGLGLWLPENWRLEGEEPGVSQAGDVLVFERITGSRELVLQVD
jgi:peptidoglycan/xylan/chitin deacetylase (PgdA/CDA1 family)